MFLPVSKTCSACNKVSLFAY